MINDREINPSKKGKNARPKGVEGKEKTLVFKILENKFSSKGESLDFMSHFPSLVMTNHYSPEKKIFMHGLIKIYLGSWSLPLFVLNHHHLRQRRWFQHHQFIAPSPAS